MNRFVALHVPLEVEPDPLPFAQTVFDRDVQVTDVNKEFIIVVRQNKTEALTGIPHFYCAINHGRPHIVQSNLKTTCANNQGECSCKRFFVDISLRVTYIHDAFGGERL